MNPIKICKDEKDAKGHKLKPIVHVNCRIHIAHASINIYILSNQNNKDHIFEKFKRMIFSHTAVQKLRRNNILPKMKSPRTSK